MGVFKTLTGENKEIDTSRKDTQDYDEFLLNDLENDSTFNGEPFLTKVYENEFDLKDKQGNKTGKKVKKYSANLYISNHETEEKLKARVNLKSPDDMITVWQGSVAYDLIDSIEELNEPGTGGINNVYNISFAELQEHINSYASVDVKVVEHTGDFWYNTLRIIGATAKGAE